jgi:hypothetical protein
MSIPKINSEFYFIALFIMVLQQDAQSFELHLHYKAISIQIELSVKYPNSSSLEFDLIMNSYF